MQTETESDETHRNETTGRPKPRHYIIIVHGIGEQKLNQTTVEVVHRFAEVRQNQPRDFQHLLPANISGQSVRLRGQGHGWSEFEGIPASPSGGQCPAFIGSPATITVGKNFRFVDMHWADILQSHQARYASTTEVWAERMNQRLGLAPREWVPGWAKRILGAIAETAIPINKLLALYKRDTAKLIFEDYLGDVHLYGDYARTRGRAVRRFHAILDEIHLRDLLDWYGRRLKESPDAPGEGYVAPEYTVIAHSLGSILSFDALVYSFARKEIRQLESSAAHPCASLPFPGYTDPWVDEGAIEGEEETWMNLLAELGRLQQKLQHIEPPLHDQDADSLISRYLSPQALEPGVSRIPPLEWRDSVRNFITLGSPIDKFLLLWYQNYCHLGLRKRDGSPLEAPQIRTSDCVENWLEARPDPRIVHYNFSDEQDPVGHHLEVAQASHHYKDIFDVTIPVAYRDIVFRRYSLPGVAHVKYWEDKVLFEGILREIVDREAPHQDQELTGNEEKRGLKGSRFLAEDFREASGAYRKALVWAYFKIPFIASMLTGGLLIYGLFVADQWLYSLAAFLGALVLWSKPTPLKMYREEARAKPGMNLWRAGMQRWKFKRGILAHIVAGAVTWRRILIRLSNSDAKEREDCFSANGHSDRRLSFRTAGGFRRHSWWRYVLASLLVVGTGAAGIDQTWLPSWLSWVSRMPPPILLSSLILSSAYLATMIYVAIVFRAEKKG